jgi:thiamine biosynthesis protein ThiS
MRISVNGEMRDFDAPLSVAGLLARLDLEPRRIAVERNASIVPRSLFSEVSLGEGDRIEIVQFVGGG